MIKKIDIQNFGIFRDYLWKNSIGNDTQDVFKKVNIIYGRNYSGKTTLARIFQCVENGSLHKDYLDAKFTILLDDGKTITENNLTAIQNEMYIHVYNSDFIKTNLSWLNNEDGTIQPFTILGSKNVEIEKSIKDIEEKLGSVENKCGLLFELNDKINVLNQKQTLFKRKKDSLDDILRAKAQKIKNDAIIYNVPTYQITSIKQDIPSAIEIAASSEEEIEVKKRLLKEEAKNNMAKLVEIKIDFPTLLMRTNEIINRKIKPSQPIIDLVNDSLLQEWVRQGIDKHKGKRKTCGFCGNPITEDLWEKLDAHFSKESEDLRNEIKTQVLSLEAAKKTIKEYLKISKNDFYISLQLKLDTTNSKWNNLITKYLENIDELIIELKEREKDIFNERTQKQINDISDDMIKTIKEFNSLIEENNQKTNTLTNDQKQARRELRLSEISQFIKDINYQKQIKEISQLEKDAIEFERIKNGKQSEVNALNEEKRALEAQTKDESKGAEIVNKCLTRFFGYDELKLVAEGQTPNMKFKITRDNIDAKNLSEGECSLISFCYFIARMEDEIKDEINNNRLLIYIDDPISSLDGNHIFFMFSLIESVIAKPKKYGQLFISTHNLDFLKYLKRITIPDRNDNVSYFLIERKQQQNNKRSFLLPMPAHIRDYVTEFNYLFNEIYKLYKEAKGDRKILLANTYNQFYNIPNNLRKFLEYYLFYKFPNNDNPLENLSKLFDDNIPILINRVINEYSHLTYIDRGWKPIDVEEVEECVKIIIEKIREKDKDQFDSLVESIK
jgi:wobble nucleotide-excising tRNase